MWRMLMISECPCPCPCPDRSYPILSMMWDSHKYIQGVGCATWGSGSLNEYIHIQVYKATHAWYLVRCIFGSLVE